MIYAFMRFAARCGREARLRKKSLAAVPIALATFAAVHLCHGLEAGAAMQGKIGENEYSLQEFHSPLPPANVIQAISGSPYPGVIDCVLQSQLPADGSPGRKADIHINYPSFGNKAVDEDIRSWVTDMADAFSSHLDTADIESALKSPDAIIDSFLNGEEQIETPSWELWGAYRISRPSDVAVSVAFELWNYTGNPEGNLDIITLNYSLLTGQRLNFVDIFEKPEVALDLMSSWARKVLEPRLGAAMRVRMLKEGTEPLVENFSSITLTPDGICINFQPWQVAPRDAGIQKVSMPLDELLPSGPLLALWGKSEVNANEHARID